ncbi:MAG: leucyl aminopeptidase [Beijerinckiaceae bacterium]|nr:MAG: leucyl aminopeptidase [Beijerinckiaceae bacterium]
MSQLIKIDFVALAPVTAQTPPQGASKRGKSGAPQTLVVFMGQDFAFGAATRALVGAEGEAMIRRAANAMKFKGKEQSAVDIVAPAGFVADRLLVIGTGAKGEESKAHGKAAKNGENTQEVVEKPADYVSLGGYVLGKLGNGACALVAFDLPRAPKDVAVAAAEFAEGMRLRDYKFDLYKTKKDDDEPAATEVAIAVEDPAAAKREAKALDAEAEGVVLARALVNEPANILYPVEFARRAAELEKLGVEVKILDEDAMKQLGMGALLGVGQGSERESRLVVMRWRGTKGGKAAGKDGGKSRPIAFVGKGVCFDSGGISIKPAGGMEEMKGDMAGAACVVGLMHALAARKAKVDAVGAIGLVENMPGANAQRPGDIVKSMSGQTIEVINTDAEGRLVLADVLWYVQDKFKPQFMVDLATLTGAVLVALGQEHAGLFSNNDELSERLTIAGKETNEKVWRLPLGAAYDKLMDSKFADVKNAGGRHAGSITAAQFLQRFVNGTPWAHLDIAGTGMNSPASDTNQGWASGYGVRLLDRLVAKYYEG